MLDHEPPDDVADAAEVTVRAALDLATDLGSTPDAVREHVALLPSRYVAVVSPRAVVRHTLMASSPLAPTEVRTRVTAGADPGGPDGIDDLDVLARDAHGWFAKVAGVVALHGGSILAADAFSRDDGLAVDTFRVEPPQGAGGSWWARVEGDLAEAAAGRLAIRARVGRKARTGARRVARMPPVPTRVLYHQDPAGRSTVVEVRSLDRIGVLYAIATALAELELAIIVARIQTVGLEVIDVFHVRNGDEQPLDPEHLRELELAVCAAIDDLPT